MDMCIYIYIYIERERMYIDMVLKKPTIIIPASD